MVTDERRWFLEIKAESRDCSHDDCEITKVDIVTSRKCKFAYQPWQLAGW